MRLIAAVLAGVLAAGCGSNSYRIRSSELARLAATPPEVRGQRVRVTEQLSDSELGPAHPVEDDTPILIFPQVDVVGYDRGRYYDYEGGGHYNPGGNGGGGGPHGSDKAPGGHGGGGGGGNSKAGSAKEEAIVILVAATVILVVAAAVEGSRFDGYAALHPMQPVHLFGKDGGYTVLPLAWIDPQTAAWADHAIVRSNEGPWNPLERAPLDREGWTYGMFGGVGTYTSADRHKAPGTATTIQLGYFFDQKVGILASTFFGWRDNALSQTLFESRYTAEVAAYPLQAGPIHFGAYGGGGLAYRWEHNGNSGSTALIGGGLLQVDINTRLAITGRFGVTQAHAQWMSDALLGLSVY